MPTTLRLKNLALVADLTLEPQPGYDVATQHVKAGRTISEIRFLDGKDRVPELARMFGGQTEAARKHATALFQ